MSEGRHAPSSPRKTPLLIIGGVAVVAAVVVLVFALSGGSDGPLGSVVGNGSPDTPEFAFKVSKTVVITTDLQPNSEAPGPTASQVQTAKKQAKAAAEPAATAAAEALDTFYTAAFLDPENWQNGEYDEAFEAFSSGARNEAESQIEVVTAGTEAAATVDSIAPMPSTLRSKVLLDPKGAPSSVVGIVKFQADGVSGQEHHTYVSKGQFFLEKVDGEWTIVGFSVSRADKDKAGGGAEGSGSTTSSSAGSESSS